MPVKNRYVIGAHISEAKFREILQLFAVDLDASQIAGLSGLSRNTVNRYLRAIRVGLADVCNSNSPFNGEGEVYESFFGARRVKGKRGRGEYSKTTVFGILQAKLAKLFIIRLQMIPAGKGMGRISRKLFPPTLKDILSYFQIPRPLGDAHSAFGHQFDRFYFELPHELSALPGQRTPKLMVRLRGSEFLIS